MLCKRDGEMEKAVHGKDEAKDEGKDSERIRAEMEKQDSGLLGMLLALYITVKLLIKPLHATTLPAQLN